MARLVLLLLAVGVLSDVAHGYKLQSFQNYASKILEKVADFIEKHRHIDHPMVISTSTPGILPEDSKALFVCSEDGFFAHPSDCSLFVHCTEGEYSVIPCREGLHFNSARRLCDEPCKAQCGETTGSVDRATETQTEEAAPPVKSEAEQYCTEDGIYSNPRNCSQFIQWSRGTPYVFTCLDGNHFSNVTQMCEAPCDAKCDRTLPCVRKSDQNPSTTEAYTTQESAESSKKVYTLKLKFVCPEDGAVEHSKDCGKFIECSNGIAYVMSCPEGLHFSKETQRCELPCVAKCDPTIPCKWRSFKKATVKESLQDFTCTEDGRYLNPEDCSSYIGCSGGEMRFEPCPDGLHFNYRTEECEEPCHARCDWTMVEECGWDDVTLKSGSANSLKQPIFDFSCVSNGLFENPHACENFIQCTGGSAYLINCPHGEHYNRDTQRCTSPCEAQCDPNYEEFCKDEDMSLSPKQRLKDFSCETDGYHANPLDCRTFIQCFQGSAYEISCPPGLHYSSQRELCVTPCEARCDPNYAHYCREGKKGNSAQSSQYPGFELPSSTESSSLTYDFICIKDGVYANPEDCSTYIQCSSGHSYVRPCPEFKEEGQTCELPCDARCNSISGDEEIDCEVAPDPGLLPAALPRYYYDVDSGRCRAFYYGGCGGNSNNFKTDEECRNRCQKKLLGGFKCPADSGMFGHYPDCMSYYHCKRGYPFLKRCPKGTAFDHTKAKCVTEYKATCVYECPDRDAVYPYEEDCHKYIDCVNGVSKLERCPPGKAFDPEKRDCVDQKHVSTCVQ